MPRKRKFEEVKKEDCERNANGLFFCETCRQVFNKGCGLGSHLRTHDDLKCTKCNFLCKQHTTLARHMEEGHGIMRLQQPTTSGSSASIRGDQKNEDDMPVLEPQTESISKDSQISASTVKQTPKGKKPLTSPPVLQKELPYTCPICFNRFETKTRAAYHFQSHRKKNWPMPKKVKADYRKLGQEKNIGFKMFSKLVVKWRLNCEYRPISLKRSQLWYFMEENFGCPLDKTFKGNQENSRMQRNLRSNPGTSSDPIKGPPAPVITSKPQQRQNLGVLKLKKLRMKGGIAFGQMLCMGIKKFYLCRGCPYVSWNLASLWRHARHHIHSSNQSYTCNACSYSSIHVHNIRHHVKSHKKTVDVKQEYTDWVRYEREINCPDFSGALGDEVDSVTVPKKKVPNSKLVISPRRLRAKNRKQKSRQQSSKLSNTFPSPPKLLHKDQYVYSNVGISGNLKTDANRGPPVLVPMRSPSSTLTALPTVPLPKRPIRTITSTLRAVESAEQANEAIIKNTRQAASASKYFPHLTGSASTSSKPDASQITYTRLEPNSFGKSNGIPIQASSSFRSGQPPAKIAKTTASSPTIPQFCEEQVISHKDIRWPSLISKLENTTNEKVMQATSLKPNANSDQYKQIMKTIPSVAQLVPVVLHAKQEISIAKAVTVKPLIAKAVLMTSSVGSMGKTPSTSQPSALNVQEASRAVTTKSTKSVGVAQASLSTVDASKPSAASKPTASLKLVDVLRPVSKSVPSSTALATGKPVFTSEATSLQKLTAASKPSKSSKTADVSKSNALPKPSSVPVASSVTSHSGESSSSVQKARQDVKIVSSTTTASKSVVARNRKYLFKNVPPARPAPPVTDAAAYIQWFKDEQKRKGAELYARIRSTVVNPSDEVEPVVEEAPKKIKQVYIETLEAYPGGPPKIGVRWITPEKCPPKSKDTSTNGNVVVLEQSGPLVKEPANSITTAAKILGNPGCSKDSETRKVLFNMAARVTSETTKQTSGPATNSKAQPSADKKKGVPAASAKPEVACRRSTRTIAAAEKLAQEERDAIAKANEIPFEMLYPAYSFEGSLEGQRIIALALGTEKTDKEKFAEQLEQQKKKAEEAARSVREIKKMQRSGMTAAEMYHMLVAKRCGLKMPEYPTVEPSPSPPPQVVAVKGRKKSKVQEEPVQERPLHLHPLITRYATDCFHFVEAVRIEKAREEIIKRHALPGQEGVPFEKLVMRNSKQREYIRRENAIEASGQCADCPFHDYKDVERLRRHRDKHFNSGPHKCTECNYSNFDRADVQKHMYIDHYLSDVKAVEGLSSSDSEEEEQPVYVEQKKKNNRKRKRRAW